MSMTKLEELNKAKKILRTFCKANDIQPPICIINNDLNCLGEYMTTPNNRRITINLKKTFISSKRNNPGKIYEKTIIGVLVHEFAHYLHYTRLYKELNNSFKKLKEPLIHYREIDIEEDIAEAIRLFILNPSLLKEGRPKRYLILSKYLKPIVKEHHSSIFNNISISETMLLYSWINNDI